MEANLRKIKLTQSDQQLFGSSLAQKIYTSGNRKIMSPPNRWRSSD